MPQLPAASSRDRPSKTSAIASIRRAALASRVRAASRRKSPADRSRRVIATAMSASAPGQWRSESRRPPKRGHVRVIGQGAWYNALYAYEAKAGVRFESGLLATGDMDIGLDTRRSLALAAKAMPRGLLPLLQAVD